MLFQLFTFLYLLRLSQATSTNTTSTACATPDATACGYRSVWSLFVSCGFTLLICVWHAIHPSVPLPHYTWIHRAMYRLYLILVALFTPEIMVAAACGEWCEAMQITRCVQARGYKWWTMTHSHFILIGGFALHDDTGIREIEIDEFLSFMEEKKIVNPVVAEDDIKDKSISDSLVKAILILQLSWFIIQIIFRLLNHLTVTLVELDIVCLTLPTLPLGFFWWKKPRCPGRPHTFYTHNFVDDPDYQDLAQGDEDMKTLQSVDYSTIRTHRQWVDLLEPVGICPTAGIAFFLTWIISGALRAIAWHYPFPTGIEKTLWRVLSLMLAGTPIIFGVVVAAMNFRHPDRPLRLFFITCGVLLRFLLTALMFASLRSLPSSAYEIIPWTSYIPHL